MAEEEGSADETATHRSWSVFGDPVGLLVFLGALCVAGTTWQVGVFITDTYAVANGLVNVAHGHLAVERVAYSLTLGSQPGLSVVDGHLYARNYGQVFLALPLYYALDLATAVVDLHLLLVAAWGLVLAAFCRQLGVVVGRRGRFQAAGSLLAAGLVVGSVPLVEPMDPDRAGVVALQVLSMVAVAATALATYRLVDRVRGRRVAVVAGVGTVVATPLWFWAAVPKRHTLTAAAVATLLFWFAASRRDAGRVALPVVGRRVPRALTLRAAGYVLVGLLAWVHAFEGLVLLGTYAVADLGTASDASRRALAAVAVAVAVGFAPFAATNAAATGDPFRPPRLTPSFASHADSFSIGPGGEVVGPADRADGGVDGDRRAADDTDSTSTPAGGGAGPSDGGGDVDGSGVRRVLSPFAEAVGFGRQIASHGSTVLEEAGNAPARLYRTYVRSGRADELTDYDVNDQEAVELSLLESNPLFGGLAAAVVGGLAVAAAGGSRRLRAGFGRRRGRRSRASPDGRWSRRVRTALSPRAWRRRLLATDPARLTDAFAVAVVAGFGLTYFPLLPLLSQLTVRYLVPALPALVYLLARVPAVAATVESRPRLLATSYGAAVVGGALAVALGVAALDAAVGEAMQLHALANLGAATVVAACVLAPTVGIDRGTRVSAVGLGLAAAATTVLVGAMQLVYFEYGVYALPFVRPLADAVSVLG